LSQFEYLAVLVSVIVGLGVVHLLSGIASLLGNRRRLTPYWVHLLWTWNVFHYLVYYWWFVWRWSAVSEWQLVLYLFVLIYAVFLYLLCAVLFPPGEEASDFREIFFRNRRPFFGLWILIVLVDVLDTRIKQQYGLSGFGPLLVVVWVTLVLGSTIAARSTSHRVQAAWGIAFFGIMSAFEYLNFRVLRAD
jgi:hypothetical protein